MCLHVCIYLDTELYGIIVNKDNYNIYIVIVKRNIANLLSGYITQTHFLLLLRCYLQFIPIVS